MTNLPSTEITQIHIGEEEDLENLTLEELYNKVIDSETPEDVKKYMNVMGQRFLYKFQPDINQNKESDLFKDASPFDISSVTNSLQSMLRDMQSNIKSIASYSKTPDTIKHTRDNLIKSFNIDDEDTRSTERNVALKMLHKTISPFFEFDQKPKEEKPTWWKKFKNAF